MTETARAVRSIDIELANPERAADFFTRVWHLTEVERRNGSIYLRGTGALHHIVAIHPAPNGFALRRLTFDAANRGVVDAIHARVAASGCATEAPHAIEAVGGGYGFGFQDVEGRNLAVICDAQDHADTADIKDRPRKITHVNLNAVELEKTNAFFTEVLGFRIVDHSGPLHFHHLDTTDHSSIVTGRASKPTLNHVAFELPDLDAVMRSVGRMRDNGYPIEWGVGRHGAGNNVFAYFAGPEEFPIETTGEVMQIDDSYEFHGPEYWKWPPNRMDQWGVTAPHTQRWKRVQDLYEFSKDAWRL